MQSHELLTEAQWRVINGTKEMNTDGMIQVIIDGVTYYGYGWEKENTDVLESPVKKSRRISGGLTMSPLSMAIKNLNKEVSLIHDRIKKLEAIKAKQGENDLPELINKWRGVCRLVLRELFDKMGDVKEDDIGKDNPWDSEHEPVEDGLDQVSALSSNSNAPLPAFGRFMQRMGINTESMHELGYDSDADDFND